MPELPEDLTLFEDDKDFVPKLVSRLVMIANEFMPENYTLRPYQVEFVSRVFESLILDDGAVITGLVSRQGGKSEALAVIACVGMVFLPTLAAIYPQYLGKYRNGFLVGAFAPVDEQADNLFGRIQERLTSDNSRLILEDPDISEKLTVRGRIIRLKNGSLVRKTTCHPKATIEGRTYHLIFIDECFPAGTPILTSEGWIPIDRIVNGNKRDWLVAAQGSDGVYWSKIKTAYKTRRLNELVRVDHEYGTLYATANHPFMVGCEKVPAISLRPGTSLSMVQADPEWSRAYAEAMQTIKHDSVLQLTQSTFEECDGTTRGTSEDVSNAEGYEPSPYCPWGEWEGTYSSSRTSVESSGITVEPRICRTHWKSNDREEPYTRNPSALQNRLSVSGEDDSDRSRRLLSRDVYTQSTGRAENCMVGESRVVSVSVLQPDSDEFSQFSDRGDYVYTLEVDIDSHTYFAAGIAVGNCQGADKVVVDKKISPMGTATNATMVFTGTPAYEKGIFYDTIRQNKRLSADGKQNHFEFDWRIVAKYNPQYKKRIEKEKIRLGEDSNEFKLSYRLIWILEKGMFTTSERLDQLGDVSMQSLVAAYNRTPIIAGIDVGRKQDRTVVTAVYVDWDNPDPYGMYYHQVLNWLDLEGMDWEEQYFKISDFLSNYNIWKVGIDTGGLGDVVAQRMKLLLPHTDIVELGSSNTDQSERWKYLMQLVEHGQISWPAGAKVRNRKVYKRFRQEMEDLEVKFKGPYVLAESPNTSNAHDDYPDSLAMACILSKMEGLEGSGEIEVSSNILYSRTMNLPGGYLRSIR